ncbi:segregation and condensation protein B [Terrimicrobium sacchariphilum]|uniref:Segregation and condensation protein B n=1 Tax=Terrimicrobium sacchariphilum TaxID=690879 RepID=A0A146GAL5_TERSA|nr:SMC-Scp complex subunit ScpB [Terrimicrobium sacchariphilum]GAT34461.1 segregation and condensation protein B [Terrimicrobium sacchariphilum]
MSKAKRKKKTEAKPAPEEAVVAPETTAEAPAEPQPLSDTPVDGAADEAVVAAEDGVAPAEAEQIDESENPPGEEAPVAEGEESAEGEAAEAAPAEENAAETEAEPTEGETVAEGEAVEGEVAETDAPLGPKWELAQVVQAILFASQKPVSPKELRNILKGAAEAEEENLSVKAFAKVKEDQLREAIEVLENRCADPQNAYEVRESAAGWQLVTKPEYAPWLRQLFPENRPARLSAPALETLAIIAYRQPITRADIEAVRGVAVDGVMQTLLDRGLVKIAGRAEIPGRPLLYETTSGFMEHFGLKNLDDLPNAGELRKIALPTAPIPEAPGAKPAETPAATETPAPEAPAVAAVAASEVAQEAPAMVETEAAATVPAGETPEASPEPVDPSEPEAEISDAGEVASEPAPTDAVESDQPVVEVAEAEAPSEASVDETESFNDTDSESQK